MIKDDENNFYSGINNALTDPERYITSWTQTFREIYHNINPQFKFTQIYEHLLDHTEHHSSAISFSNLIEIENIRKTRIRIVRIELALLFIFSYLDLLEERLNCDSELARDTVMEYVHQEKLCGYLAIP